MSTSDSTTASSPASTADQPKLPKPPALRPGKISSARRRSLRAQAHHLRPVVQIGQAGLTEGVIAAVQVALDQHELIKVSINGESPTERKSGAIELGEATGSHVVQVIGRVIILFREAKRTKAKRSKPAASTSRGASANRSPSKSTRSRQRGQR
jgi:RNA-binding protein